ncbi:MAG: hypothetical protein K2M14_00925, partial [Muribaculaceae bacterium]|nr:hypothetical protein [Muribaculaceae bacterium]
HILSCRRRPDIEMAWGWTVYFVKGVWRCLRYDKQDIAPRFLHFYSAAFPAAFTPLIIDTYLTFSPQSSKGSKWTSDK